MSPETLADGLVSAWERWAERPALSYDGGGLTYAQFGRASRALAERYRRLGVGRGDRVVCAVSNRPEYIVALGAAWVCGAVHVGVDYQFTAPELAFVAEHTQAKALIYEPADDAPDPAQTLRALRERCPDLRILLVGGRAQGEERLALADLLDSAGEGQPERPEPQDPAIIFISSGTTGRPKATIGYQGNLGQRWPRLAAWLGFTPDDVHLAHLPLSHGFGLMMAVGALLSGGQLALLSPFTAEAALQAITRSRVTVLNGAPTHFKLILNRLDRARHDIGSLRLSVGTAAAFPRALVEAIWAELGVKFMFMYGASEGVGVATTDPEDIRLGSVGRPAPGSVAIVGPDRQPLPPGENGEVAFSRKVFPVRYWGEQADGDWYYSGDLGRLDEEGRLYVFGRIKHQIDRGGLKVDPVEVERALLGCPDVADAAVIGLPNPILGEIVCACVVPLPGRAPALEGLRAALRDELASYKLPEELCLLERIPRTQIGKVDLGQLRSEVASAARQQIRQR
jgi:acyl-CoA synthetase (AMP-forming)/AMP-acid ligase II